MISFAPDFCRSQAIVPPAPVPRCENLSDAVKPNARMGKSRSHRVFVGSVAAGATEVGGGALLVPITAFFSASGVFDQLIGDIVLIG